MHEGIFEYWCPADANEIVCIGKGQGKGVPLYCHEGVSDTGTAALVV